MRFYAFNQVVHAFSRYMVFKYAGIPPFFFMLRRARRLRNIIDNYYRTHEYSQLNISDIEWGQIDYLVHLTKLFLQFAIALIKTKDVIIHNVLLVYKETTRTY